MNAAAKKHPMHRDGAVMTPKLAAQKPAETTSTDSLAIDEEYFASLSDADFRLTMKRGRDEQKRRDAKLAEALPKPEQKGTLVAGPERYRNKQAIVVEVKRSKLKVQIVGADGRPIEGWRESINPSHFKVLG